MLVEQWHSHWVKVQMKQAFRAQLIPLDCTWLGSESTAVLQHLSYEVKLTVPSTGQLNWWRHSGRPIAIVQTAVDEPKACTFPWIQ